jgi:methylmalonyl-CoA epimerase
MKIGQPKLSERKSQRSGLFVPPTSLRPNTTPKVKDYCCKCAQKKAQPFLTVRKTKVGFFKVGESNIESVELYEPDSPLVCLEIKGPGIQHICFEVDDVEAEVKAYFDKGATLIDQKPRPGAHNTKVAFVHPKSSKWCSHRTP